MDGRRYDTERVVVRVSQSGAWVLRSRVVGIFGITIPKVHRMMQRYRNTDRLVDVTAKQAMKSLVLLDDGTAVLSPLAPLTIAKRMNHDSQEGD
ncbi:MAG: extracellular matrix/biofilm biosynthesis regulator RemA family protein [Armatimonadota bacterium]